MNNPIIITGSSGYLGSALVSYLKRNQKDMVIIGLDKRPPSNAYLDKFYEIDLQDKDKILRILSEIKITFPSSPIFIHAAALFVKKFQDRANYSDEDYLKNNIRALENLLDILSQSEQLHKLIFISTAIASVDGKNDSSSPLGNLDMYAKTKLAGEKLIQSSNLPWVIIRSVRMMGYPEEHEVQKSLPSYLKPDIHNVIKKGEYEHLPDDIVSYFLSAYFRNYVSNNETLQVKPGNLKRTYMHIHDIVSGLTHVALDPYFNKLMLNFSTNTSITLTEIAKIIVDNLKTYGFTIELKIEDDANASEVYTKPTYLPGWNPKYKTSQEVIKKVTDQYIRTCLNI